MHFSGNAIKSYQTWVKIGFLSLGGAAIIAPVVQNELVEKQRILSMEEFIDDYTQAKMLPGAIALSMAVIIGYRFGGFKSSLAATLGMITPSLVTVGLVLFLSNYFYGLPFVQLFFEGIRPVIPALLGGIAIRMSQTVIKNRQNLLLMAFLLGSFLFFKINLTYLLLLSGVFGILMFYRKVKSDDH